MTPQQQRVVRTSIITTVVGTVGLFAVWLVTTGWTSIVKRPEFDLHTQHEERMHERAALADSIQRELLLDIKTLACRDYPTDSQCGRQQ